MRGRFDVLQRNLRGLHQAKLRARSALPRLTFNAIIMRSTIAGLADLVDFAASCGVTDIEAKPLVTYPNVPAMHGERIVYEPERDDASLQRARERASALGVNLGLDAYVRTREASSAATASAPATTTDAATASPEAFVVPATLAPCPLPFRTMYVQASGGVKPCCFASGKPEHVLGNLHQQSAADVWNGDRYRRFRAQLLAGETPDACNHCVKFRLAPGEDATVDWLTGAGFPVPSLRPLDLAVKAVEGSMQALRAMFSGTEPALQLPRKWLAAAKTVQHLGEVQSTLIAWLPELGVATVVQKRLQQAAVVFAHETLLATHQAPSAATLAALLRSSEQCVAAWAQARETMEEAVGSGLRRLAEL